MNWKYQLPRGCYPQSGSVIQQFYFHQPVRTNLLCSQLQSTLCRRVELLPIFWMGTWRESHRGSSHSARGIFAKCRFLLSWMQSGNPYLWLWEGLHIPSSQCAIRWCSRGLGLLRWNRESKSTSLRTFSPRIRISLCMRTNKTSELLIGLLFRS